MIRTLASILAVGLAFAAFGMTPAAAQDASVEEQKDAWQSEYRTLLRRAAHLEYTAEASRENYARAQRRNYPRGGARQQFLVDADKAERQLVEIKDEIEGFLTAARLNAIPPHWRYAVEDEDHTFAPAARASDDELDDEADDEADDDREGRNPLYLKDDEAN